MWPMKLDYTPEECRGILRQLELDSYAKVVSALRAQGSLNDPKRKILSDLRDTFHITTDRHKAEVRRAVNDEKLTTVAEVISGPATELEWKKEGRRNVPPLPRMLPYTAFTRIADRTAAITTKSNSKLKQPSETVRKNENLLENLPISSVPLCVSDPYGNSIGESNELPSTSKTVLKKPAKRSYTVDPNKVSLKRRNKSHLLEELQKDSVKKDFNNSKLQTTKVKKLTIRKKKLLTARTKKIDSRKMKTVTDESISTFDEDYLVNSTNRRLSDTNKLTYPRYGVYKDDLSQSTAREQSVPLHIKELQKRLMAPSKSPSIPILNPLQMSPTSKLELLSQQIIPSSKRDIASNLNKLNLFTQQHMGIHVQSTSIIKSNSSANSGDELTYKSSMTTLIPQTNIPSSIADKNLQKTDDMAGKTQKLSTTISSQMELPARPQLLPVRSQQLPTKPIINMVENDPAKAYDPPKVNSNHKVNTPQVAPIVVTTMPITGSTTTTSISTAKPIATTNDNTKLPHKISLKTVPNNSNNIKLIQSFVDNKSFNSTSITKTTSTLTLTANKFQILPPTIGPNGKPMIVMHKNNSHNASIAGTPSVTMRNKIVLPKGIKIIPAQPKIICPNTQQQKVPSTIVGTTTASPSVSKSINNVKTLSIDLNKGLVVDPKDIEAPKDVNTIVSKVPLIETTPLSTSSVNANVTAPKQKSNATSSIISSTVQSLAINTSISNNILNRSKINITNTSNLNFINFKNVKLLSNVKQLSNIKPLIPITTITSTILSSPTITSMANALPITKTNPNIISNATIISTTTETTTTSKASNSSIVSSSSEGVNIVPSVFHTAIKGSTAMDVASNYTPILSITLDEKPLSTTLSSTTEKDKTNESKSIMTDWEKELDGEQIVIDKNEIINNRHKYEELCGSIETDTDEEDTDNDSREDYLTNLQKTVYSSLNNGSYHVTTTQHNTQNDVFHNSYDGMQTKLGIKSNIEIVNKCNKIKTNGEIINKFKNNVITTKTYQSKEDETAKEDDNFLFKILEINDLANNSINELRKMPVAEASGET